MDYYNIAFINCESPCRSAFFIRDAGSYNEPQRFMIYRVSDGECVYSASSDVIDVDRVSSISRDGCQLLKLDHGPKSYAIEWEYDE